MATYTQQGPKIVGVGTPPDPGDEGQGRSVAISADGTILVSGAPGDDFGTTRGNGEVFIFRLVLGAWELAQVLDAPSADGLFGYSVGMSADGATVVVGQWDAGSSATGAAWVYRHDEVTDQWEIEQQLESPGSNSQFGFAVAISSDGNTVIVGSPAVADHLGGASIWIRDGGGGWSHDADLVCSTAVSGDISSPGSSTGQFVAISGDGLTVAFTGPGLFGFRVDAGSVFFFDGAAWGEQFTFAGAASTAAVALSYDGDLMLVGDTAANTFVGEVGSYIRTAGSWSLDETILPNDASGPTQFGIAVALSDDGTVAAIGGSADNGQLGAFWVFENTGSWVGSDPLTPNDWDESSIVRFGFAVDITSDGFTVAVGAPFDADIGGAWVFLVDSLSASASLTITFNVTVSGVSSGQPLSIVIGSRYPRT